VTTSSPLQSKSQDPVLDPVWKLYARAIERTGPTATLLEWDDNIPSFAEVHAEALKANRYRTTPAQLEPEVLANLNPEHLDEVPS
jgi:uncharacterized protein (UPF0276 family)